TVWGPILEGVRQAKPGNTPQFTYAPPPPHPIEIERQRATAKGVRLSIIGGGIVAVNFFGFIFSAHRGGSPFGFWTFIGFLLLALGISKIFSSPPPGAASTPAPKPHETGSINQANPHPVFSAPAAVEPAAPRTTELEPVRSPSLSVTEDDTRHLPHSKPPHELSR